MRDIVDNPRHPYTHGLINCVPILKKDPGPERVELNEIPGVVPSMAQLGTGCSFAPRCHKVLIDATKKSARSTGWREPLCQLLAGWGDRMNSAVTLKVDSLRTYFKVRRPHLFAEQPTVYAVDGVSFEIASGKTLGLVGESGCGKSTTAFSVLRLVEPTSGSVVLKGIDICHLNENDLRNYRRHMQIIFQDPYSSMNPRTTAGEIIRAPLKILKIGTPEEQHQRVEELLSLVGLRPEQKKLYPHQFSGGQRQRICVARALAPNPDFIVCDEPVSALDVAIQSQILNLLARLQREFGLTYLFISHDMAVVQHICDEIAVMYLAES